MRIRSATIGTNVSYPLDPSRFRAFGRFQARARALFEDAGLEVQTVRLATQPFPEVLRDAGPAAAVPFARELEGLCQAHGIDYCSIGPVVATRPESENEDEGEGRDKHGLAYVDVIPEVIRRTEMVFASALVTSAVSGINLVATRRAAQAIADIAHSTPRGFGNLRFAVLANCGPGTPFFPAAFHSGAGPAFSIATEAADLAVDAFAQATTLEEARVNMRAAVEGAARTIERICRALEAEFGFRFGGIDFSLAPYPELARSVGHAIERLGVEAFGGPGTLFAVAFITRVLREARFSRCGFSGVFLPVLEDRTLAQRSAENMFTLDGLLLCSAVCGTGLDTIPLPGDVSVEELAAILLDVATLALVADKPLTARLMPIPGKGAGEPTDFDFPYFANARILDARERGVPRIFERNRFVGL
jgi:uncharacterized protein (UPF0210 family)